MKQCTKSNESHVSSMIIFRTRMYHNRILRQVGYGVKYDIAYRSVFGIAKYSMYKKLVQVKK